LKDIIDFHAVMGCAEKEATGGTVEYVPIPTAIFGLL
jgi:hypothetical protein